MEKFKETLGFWKIKDKSAASYNDLPSLKNETQSTQIKTSLYNKRDRSTFLDTINYTFRGCASKANRYNVNKYGGNINQSVEANIGDLDDDAIAEDANDNKPLGSSLSKETTSGVTGSIISIPENFPRHRSLSYNKVQDSEGCLQNILNNIRPSAWSLTDEMKDTRVTDFVKMSQDNNQSKYASAPNNIQDAYKRDRKRSTRSEYALNIHGSDVSIYLPEKGGSSPSLLSLTQSEHERRDSIQAFTEDKLEEYREKSTYHHTREKVAMRKLQTEGIVIIVSDDGSGGKHLAYELLAQFENAERFIVTNVTNLEEAAVCSRSLGTSVIVHINPFGLFDVDKVAFEKLMNRVTLANKRKQKHIITVKRRIAEQSKHMLGQYKSYIVDLEDQELQFNADERYVLMNTMIKNNHEAWIARLEEEGLGADEAESLLNDIATVSWSSGFPKRFLCFITLRENFKKGIAYFTDLVKEVYSNICGPENSVEDKDKCLALVLLAMVGGHSTKEKIDAIAAELKGLQNKRTRHRKQSKRKQSISTKSPWWIVVIQYYSNHCTKSFSDHVNSGIGLLKNRLIKQTSLNAYTFSAVCIKYSVWLSIGKNFPQFILRFCDLDFFKLYIAGSMSELVHEGENVKIDTTNTSVCEDAIRKMMDIHESGDIEIFAKHMLMSDAAFVENFIRSLHGKPDLFWQTTTKHDRVSGRNISQILLEKDPITNFHTTRHYLAYQVILHKYWGQERKRDEFISLANSMELNVLAHACSVADHDIYRTIKSKYKKNPDLKCMLEAVDGKAVDIVSDILKSGHLSDLDMCKAMELALILYTKDTVHNRRLVINKLQQSVAIDYKVSGIEPFIFAAGVKTGNARTIITINSLKGDINLTNSCGRTILHEAVILRQYTFLELALKHGADQRKRDTGFGRLPIHEAVIRNDLKSMKILLEGYKLSCYKDDRQPIDHETILVAHDKDGRQPLHYAVWYHSLDAIKFLLERNVSVSDVDDEHKSPLHYALEYESDDLYRLFDVLSTRTRHIARDVVKKLDKDQVQSCMFNAVDCNNDYVLSYLFNSGFDFNSISAGKTLLNYAIEKNPYMIPLLLKYNVDVNTASNGTFPVHVATRLNQIDTIKLLVNSGADIGIKETKSGDTVLHIATKMRADNIILYLLQNTDLLGEQNKIGNVPLHEAVRKIDFECVRLFMGYGAETSRINREGETPIKLAESLLESMANPDQRDKMSRIRLLLQRIGSVNLETEV